MTNTTTRFIFDILATVAGSDLVQAVVTGRYVSIGRGSAKKVTAVKSARVRASCHSFRHLRIRRVGYKEETRPTLEI